MDILGTIHSPINFSLSRVCVGGILLKVFVSKSSLIYSKVCIYEDQGNQSIMNSQSRSCSGLSSRRRGKASDLLEQ